MNMCKTLTEICKPLQITTKLICTAGLLLTILSKNAHVLLMQIFAISNDTKNRSEPSDMRQHRNVEWQ